MPPSRNYRIFIHVAAVLVSIVCLAPFVWLFIASTAATPDLLTRPLHWIPQHPSLDRYRQIFDLELKDQEEALGHVVASRRNEVTTVRGAE